MSWSLINKLAVVTGGADGIGYEIVKVFLRKGVRKVIILDINETLGKAASDKLNTEFNNKVVFIKCDVTKDMEKTADIIFKNFKTVDVLVNNAGIAEQELKRTVDINVIAVLNWSFEFYEHMRKDKGGSGGTIINLASQAAYVERPFLPIYNATKWAVLGFSKTLGHKYNFNRTGVRVVALCPAVTNTTLMAKNSTRIPVEDRGELYNMMKKNAGCQEPDAVGRAAGEVFEKGDSGTAWEIMNNEPIKQVIHNVTLVL